MFVFLEVEKIRCILSVHQTLKLNFVLVYNWLIIFAARFVRDQVLRVLRISCHIQQCFLLKLEQKLFVDTHI